MAVTSFRKDGKSAAKTSDCSTGEGHELHVVRVIHSTVQNDDDDDAMSLFVNSLLVTAARIAH